jgi:large-conductance mechanosensitive channel
MFFVAQLAEGNRTPFDLPEAESELVSGYNTEYSGMRFLMFFLAEFANVWVMAAISVALFFGGWQIPFGTLADGITPAPWLLSASGVVLAVMMLGGALPALGIGVGLLKYRTRAHAAIQRANMAGNDAIWKMGIKLVYDGAMAVHLVGAVALVGGGFPALSFAEGVDQRPRLGRRPRGSPSPSTRCSSASSFLKTLTIVFIVIQLRWTLPRMRVDQMMTLCWKYMVPISFVCVLGVLVWELVIHSAPFLNYLMRWVMFASFIFLVVSYVKKIRASYDADKDNFEKQTGQTAYFPPWKLV